MLENLSFDEKSGKVNNSFLISCTYTAISSYFINPNLYLGERLQVIRGMCFYKSVFLTHMNVMDNMDESNRIAFCIEEAKKIENDIGKTFLPKDQTTFELGIKYAAGSTANLNDKSKQK